MMRINPDKHFRYGLERFGEHLHSLVAGFEKPDILELGGGRRPSFNISDMPTTINSYTVNDVNPDELALAAPEYRKACFDVTGDTSEFEGRYDVIFSRFLAEHVADGKAMHRNVHRLLKPGGVAFHLIPTLFASPFIVNSLLPEAIAQQLLVKLLPYRRSISPKFPAHYSYCFGDIGTMHKLFDELKYAKIDIRNFYGHYYYDKVPVVREVDNFLAAMAAKYDIKHYSSYAYLRLHK